MLSQVMQEQIVLLERFIQVRPQGITDLGAGLGQHTQWFLDHGQRVLAVDRHLTPDLAAIVESQAESCRFVASDVGCLPFADNVLGSIWASHCLEHMDNPLAVLGEWRRVLRPEGILAVLVPPYKTEIVGRHVFTGWNVGQLMLTLFRAGYRVRDGVFARQGYNVFAMVRKCDSPSPLQPNDEILFQFHDQFPPDLERQILQQSFQNGFGETVGRFEGDIARLGW